jgi:hypothetical protein
MIINENILQAMGAEIENYNISENIFSEEIPEPLLSDC